MGSRPAVSTLSRATKMRFSLPVLALLVFTFVAEVHGMPDKTSCSSPDCKTCLDSCDSCDQCGLCALCFGQTLGPCANCKYCKGGAAGCKKVCNKGKSSQTCQACIQNCS